jgi:hypothetical protein
MAIVFKQALQGEEIKPLFTNTEFQQMLSSITNHSQGKIFNGYIEIHEWLSIKWNAAQASIQQAQRQYATLTQYIINATTAEDIYKYIKQLPAIMTQKQYDEIRAQRIEEQLTGENEDKQPLTDNVFQLIVRAISFYLEQLRNEPKKANPLKPIKKKYQTQMLTSPFILSLYDKAMGINSSMIGHHLNVKYGRRYEQMKMINEERQMAVKNNADTAQRRKDYAENYAQQIAFPCLWRYYEDPPEDFHEETLNGYLTKWDIIEHDYFLGFYPVALGGKQETTERSYIAEVKDFLSEFKELADIVIKDIDIRYFKGEAGITDLPLEEWEVTIFNWKTLYEKDAYGIRAKTDSDASIFTKNSRAIINGIAILKTNDLLDISPLIDEKGYYTEANIYPAISNISLESFFPEAKEYADTAGEIKLTLESFLDSIYFLKGYNYTLDIIADYYDVPEIAVFKTDLKFLEEKVNTYNALVPMLYSKIKDAKYMDEELQAKKLKVLEDFFPEIEWNEIIIPEQNKEEAQILLKNFKAFSHDYANRFLRLLNIRPKDEDEGGLHDE